MLLSALSFFVVAQSSSEVPEGLMNNPVCAAIFILLLEYSEKGEENNDDDQTEI